MDEFKATGAISVNKTEFNRQVGKKFDELLGSENSASEVWAILNGHPERIASLEAFLEGGLEEEGPRTEVVGDCMPTIKLSKVAG